MPTAEKLQRFARAFETHRIAGGPQGAFGLEQFMGLAEESEFDAVRTAHDRLLNGDPISDRQAFLYEAIIVAEDRPALIVRNGTYETPNETSRWYGLGETTTRARLERAIEATGRVELSPGGGRYEGTAFVVGHDLLMTNRHVAEAFTRGIGLNPGFRDGAGVVVNFRREKDRKAGRSSRVGRVVLVHPYWDMALLEVESLGRDPLQMDAVAPENLLDEEVVAIGHPGRTLAGNKELQRRVFQGVFNVKRVQPGYGLGRREYKSKYGRRETLGHDSSTQGGSSGSLVLRVDTGNVVGLHFAGDPRNMANHAVAIFDLARDIRVHQAGVNFVTGAPDPSDPWGYLWQDRASSGSEGTSIGANRVVIQVPIALKIRVSEANDG